VNYDRAMVHQLWFIGDDDTKEKGIAFMVHKNTLPTGLESRPTG